MGPRVRRQQQATSGGGPRRPGHNKAPAGGRGGRRGRGRGAQHPPSGRRRPGLALRSPAPADSGGRSGRRRKRRRKGAGGGGSGVAQSRDPAPRQAGLRKTGADSARRSGPSWAGDPSSKVPPVSTCSSSRSHRDLRCRAGAAGATSEAQLAAGRTLRTLRMNDDNAAHLERVRVSTVPPRALRAELGSCGWLRGNLRGSLLGTMCQALGPPPIPTGRTPPACVGDLEDSSARAHTHTAPLSE
uniref:translation initiation factor IF-2-like n=1 Tax=Callithrix jacchus TaxID=9483 RepID=UPI00159F5A06|nr:translation initiation factor IF-2-like [Callithrix jacchus]